VVRFRVRSCWRGDGMRGGQYVEGKGPCGLPMGTLSSVRPHERDAIIGALMMDLIRVRCDQPKDGGCVSEALRACRCVGEHSRAADKAASRPSFCGLAALGTMPMTSPSIEDGIATSPRLYRYAWDSQHDSANAIS
jgi:hypothetical protein